MIQTQELDKLEDVGSAEAVYLLGGALGDQVCVSGSINQFYKQNNKKLYIITELPTLFVQQDYCREVIDLNILSGNGEYDESIFFKKFNKIHTLFWQTQKHLQGQNTIVENYCDQLKVQKVKYPYFKIDKQQITSKNKPYILVSLKKPESKIPFIKLRGKGFTDKTNDEIIKNLQNDFKDYDIIDIGRINISSFHELLVVVANCTTFLSIDTALQHLAANAFCQKKGVVLWNNHTNKEIYGYDIHKNLCEDFIQPFDNYGIIRQNLIKFL